MCKHEKCTAGVLGKLGKLRTRRTFCWPLCFLWRGELSSAKARIRFLKSQSTCGAFKASTHDLRADASASDSSELSSVGTTSGRGTSRPSRGDACCPTANMNNTCSHLYMLSRHQPRALQSLNRSSQPWLWTPTGASAQCERSGPPPTLPLKETLVSNGKGRRLIIRRWLRP